MIMPIFSGDVTYRVFLRSCLPRDERPWIWGVAKAVCLVGCRHLGIQIVGLDVSYPLAAATTDTTEKAEEAVSGAETEMEQGDGSCVAVQSDAAVLPFADASFDLVMAFMCLQDMDQLSAVCGEITRVLEPGGRFCAAVTHPMQTAGAFTQESFLPEKMPRFVIPEGYFPECHMVFDEARDGVPMTFHMYHHSIETYMRAFVDAGFVLDLLREPVPDEECCQAFSRLRKWQRVPCSLYPGDYCEDAPG